MNNTNPIVRIETPRLFLVPPKVDISGILLEAVYASMNDVSPWLNWANPKLTEGQLKQFIAYSEKCHLEKEPNNLFFSIFDKKSQKYIGDVYYGTIDWMVPYFAIGYWVDSRESGKGAITEAVNALTRLALEHFKAKRVEISMSNNNFSSKKVPERLGFVLEGALRNHHVNFVTGEVSDTLMYARYNTGGLPFLDVKWFCGDEFLDR